MAGGVFPIIFQFFRQHCDWLAVIGALYASYLALKVTCSIWHGLKVYFLSPLLGLGTNPASFGSWAVVTGATDGIGRAYAEELAKKGLNIVLISRSVDKLKDVAKAIEQENPSIKTKCIVTDFSGDFDIYPGIEDEINALEIGILVNNVGVGYHFPDSLTEIKYKDIGNIINVNCNAVTYMTKIALVNMIRRKKGLIINISSQSGLYPVPLLTVYSATKAYVEFFSRGVEAEYKSQGISVQCVAPSFVATKLSKIRNASFFIPNPTSYVKSALATIGLESHTSGCMVHSILEYVMLSLPEWIRMKLIMSAMDSARSKAISKRSKDD